MSANQIKASEKTTDDGITSSITASKDTERSKRMLDVAQISSQPIENEIATTLGLMLNSLKRIEFLLNEITDTNLNGSDL